MTTSALKIAFLYLCRTLGLFALARYLTRKQLRILCYHGFSHRDEHRFRPKLFMRAETLRRRLSYIQRNGFNVMPFAEATELLPHDRLPPNSLIITIDDGWYGTFAFAHPVFKEFAMPWTLYLTTYYALKQTQVINIAFQYLFWKTPLEHLDITDWMLDIEPTHVCNDKAEMAELCTKLVAYADSLDGAEERQALVTRLAEQLQVDWDDYLAERVFFLINSEETRVLAEEGVDIQLHTHRHCLPADCRESLFAELDENAHWIREFCDANPRHLCYPSGYYTEQHLDWLTQYGITSATTCNPGLNDAATPMLELSRFLDGEDVHQIEFEAEISGLKQLLRNAARLKT